MDRLNEITNKLKKYNQEHLLSFYNELKENEKNKLLTQLERIDFEQMEALYKQTKEKPVINNLNIEPLEYVDKYQLSRDKYNEYYNAGMHAIKRGTYAVVTMAGGQGTRLGHNGPKGTYNIGLSTNKSIFEILCDTLKTAVKTYNRVIPWYIMTSRENNEQTIKYFEENNYLGYGRENIKFFMQGELPMLHTDGKIILESKSCIKEAADGHGGVFEAIYRNYIFEDMKQKGIEWVFVGGVDNILVKLVDAFFLGVAIIENKVIAEKSVIKAHPKEKVGVFCRKQGKPGVIEYTEITDELANMRNEDGNLVFCETNIVSNLFNISVLEKLQTKKLPYHVAFKKVTYINEAGEKIEAEEPNAYKFESFIFDALEDFDDVIIVRSKREEEFAPVKNREGEDSPETARKLYEAYWGENK